MKTQISAVWVIYSTVVVQWFLLQVRMQFRIPFTIDGQLRYELPFESSTEHTETAFSRRSSRGTLFLFGQFF